MDHLQLSCSWGNRSTETAGRRLSALGFGTAPIGNLYTGITDEEAEAALDEALCNGVRYFDTAPFYGYGLSEQRLGRALEGISRSNFTISTKVGRLLTSDGASGLSDGFAVQSGGAVFDYTRDGILRSFEASLQRLRLNRIDILLLHDIGRLTHGNRHEAVMKHVLDYAIPTMAALRDSGAIDAIGIGVNEQAIGLELLRHIDLDWIMLAGRYTLLEQADSIEIMSVAQTRGVKVIAAAPYNSGLLANSEKAGSTYNYRPVPSQMLERAQRIYTICAQEGIDVGAAALQLPLAHPSIVSVATGLRSAAEVRSALVRLQTPIPASLWSRLREAGLLEPSTVVPGN